MLHVIKTEAVLQKQKQQRNHSHSHRNRPIISEPNQLEASSNTSGLLFGDQDHAAGATWLPPSISCITWAKYRGFTSLHCCSVHVEVLKVTLELLVSVLQIKEACYRFRAAT